MTEIRDEHMAMLRQQKDWDKLSFKQKFDLIQGALHLPALTVMLFARGKLGYRTLNPTYLLVTGFLLILAQNVQTPYFVVGPATLWPYPLTLFVVAMLAWATIQRRLRWRDMVSGIRWHSYSRGVSYFSFLPLREDIVARFVDPIVCMLVGLFAWYFISSALGLWIMFASLAFAVGEARYYDMVLGNTLDLLDGLEEVRVGSEFMMTMDTLNTGATRKLEDTSGIPTGVGDDLVRAVQKRMAEARNASPSAIDNAA